MSLTTLLVSLITGLFLAVGYAPYRTCASTTSTQGGLAHFDRMIVKTSWRNEPVRIKGLKTKSGSVTFGKKFLDQSDDWLEGLTVAIENTSNNDIISIDLGLTLFTREGRDKTTNVPIKFPIRYGAASVGGSNHSQLIQAGATVDVTLSEKDYFTLKEGLTRSNYPLKFRHAELSVDRAVFANGTMWYKGYIFVRDPNNPELWLREKTPPQ